MKEKTLANQTTPNANRRAEPPAAPDNRSEAIRQADRDLYGIRHQSEMRCGSDILIFVGIFLAVAIALAAVWYVWAAILNTPSHQNGLGPALLLPGSLPLLLTHISGFLG